MVRVLLSAIPVAEVAPVVRLAHLSAESVTRASLPIPFPGVACLRVRKPVSTTMARKTALLSELPAAAIIGGAQLVRFASTVVLAAVSK